MNVVKEIQKLGLKADNYQRPPLHKDLFTTTIQRKTHRFWVPDADKVEIATSKKHRQAVINVEDGNAPVEEKIERTYIHLDKFAAGYLEKELRRNSKINIPNSFMEVSNEKQRIEGKGKDRKLIISGTILHTPDNEMPKDISMLVGIDETTNFVALLPERVKSVSDAHDLLKPDELRGKKGVLRQGEWFFEPLSTEQHKQLVQEMSNRNYDMEYEYPMEIESFHSAQIALVDYSLENDTPTYVMGEISDSRGRRHKSLYLTSFHRVVRNTELVSDNVNADTWD